MVHRIHGESALGGHHVVGERGRDGSGKAGENWRENAREAVFWGAFGAVWVDIAM